MEAARIHQIINKQISGLENLGKYEKNMVFAYLLQNLPHVWGEPRNYCCYGCGYCRYELCTNGYFKYDDDSVVPINQCQRCKIYYCEECDSGMDRDCDEEENPNYCKKCKPEVDKDIEIFTEFCRKYIQKKYREKIIKYLLSMPHDDRKEFLEETKKKKLADRRIYIENLLGTPHDDRKEFLEETKKKKLADRRIYIENLLGNYSANSKN